MEKVHVRDVEIVNEKGLHARAAAMFVKEAEKFEARIEVCRGEQTVEGRSIMGLMMLAAACGSTVQIRGRGKDAPAALDALEKLVRQGFYEGV